MAALVRFYEGRNGRGISPATPIPDRAIQRPLHPSPEARPLHGAPDADSGEGAFFPFITPILCLTGVGGAAEVTACPKLPAQRA
jgi:hypothetical protein